VNVVDVAWPAKAGPERAIKVEVAISVLNVLVMGSLRKGFFVQQLFAVIVV
jgi:hypothetical protein